MLSIFHQLSSLLFGIIITYIGWIVIEGKTSEKSEIKNNYKEKQLFECKDYAERRKLKKSIIKILRYGKKIASNR